MEVQKPARLNYLEGMRGIAALVVVIHHLGLAFYPLSQSMDPKALEQASLLGRIFLMSPMSLFLNGHLAVLLFFVHSGLVLSYSFFSKGRDQRLLVSSAGARYFRLTAPIAVSIFLAYLMHRLGMFATQETAAISGSANWLARHYAFEPNFWEAVKQSIYSQYYSFAPQVRYNSSLWTIGVELCGSFVVYAFLSLFGNLRRRWLIHLVALLIYHRSQIFPMLLGMGLCDLFCNLKIAETEKKKRIGKWLPSLTLFIGLYAASFKTTAFPLYTIFTLINEHFLEYVRIGGAVLIVASLLHLPVAQWLLTRRPILFLGRISYSVYLLHIPILCSFTCNLFLFLYKKCGLSFPLSVGISAPLTMVLTIGLSAIFCRLVDESSMRIGKEIFQRVFSPSLMQREAGQPQTSTNVELGGLVATEQGF